MTRFCVVFPGQGSQYVGMGRQFIEASGGTSEGALDGETAERVRAMPDLSDLWREAEQVTGLPLRRLCLEGPEEVLVQTEITQPALLVASVAAWRVLEQVLAARGLEPAYAAGHSLGEFSALVAAGVVDFASACRLVATRGRLMARAAREHPGAMAAVLGLGAEEVAQACRTAEEETGEVVAPANFNCPGQIVISGTKRGVVTAGEKARAAGARRIVPLAVSGPFHTRLLGAAAAEFSRLLDDIALKRPAFPVVQNITGAPASEPEEIRDNLRRQMTGPVRWEESLRGLDALGVSTFVEVGPGKVLSGLVRKTLPGAATFNVEGLTDVKEVLDFLQEGR